VKYLVMLALILGACGEDEAAAPPPPPPKAPGGAGAKKGGPPKKVGVIRVMKRIEDRVTCPPPSDAKKCDPKTPICGTGEYCIEAGAGNYCGPCPERDAIRHVFKPRDFQGADIRDPFQSFVISQPGIGTQDKTPTEVTPRCTRKDQFVASSFGYQSLRLVGIVSQGTQRKALMMGGNMGYILRKGDCVGKEKAFVKDIGAGFITYSTEAANKADTIEYTIQLYPTTLTPGTPDAIDPGAASAPIVAPPSGGGTTLPAPDDRPTGTTTTIVRPPTQTPPPPQPQGPPQAPVQLKP
jgi:hypothetical protein